MPFDSFIAEIDYLQDYVGDCLRELSFIIHHYGPCDAFQARVDATSVNCRTCAYTWIEHD
jgi:hypothetical protein